MKISRINLKSFWDYCKRYDLLKGLMDLREPARYQKSNRLIYEFMFLMSALGKGSFLGMDQSSRLSKLKRLFHVKRFTDKRLRHCVVSDTTMIRRLRTMHSSDLIQINYDVLIAGMKRGDIKPIAYVDGTGLSGRLYSCLSFMTRWGDVMLIDCEEIQKRGKELLASERLIARCNEYLGKGMIELLLVDMLYFNERFWKLREEGYIKDLLIKYSPDFSQRFKKPYRKILHHFEALRSLYLDEDPQRANRKKLDRMSFSHRCDMDSVRGVQYEIYCAQTNSYDRRYKVARVIEQPANRDEERDFYVLTTDKSLSPERMRKLGHQRWYIENDGFKALNAHVRSKRVWTKHGATLSNLIRIWMLAFSLLVLYRREFARQIKKRFNQVKLTYRFLAIVFHSESFGRLRLDGN